MTDNAPTARRGLLRSGLTIGGYTLVGVTAGAIVDEVAFDGSVREFMGGALPEGWGDGARERFLGLLEGGVDNAGDAAIRAAQETAQIGPAAQVEGFASWLYEWSSYLAPALEGVPSLSGILNTLLRVIGYNADAMAGDQATLALNAEGELVQVDAVTTDADVEALTLDGETPEGPTDGTVVTADVEGLGAQTRIVTGTRTVERNVYDVDTGMPEMNADGTFVTREVEMDDTTSLWNAVEEAAEAGDFDWSTASAEEIAALVVSVDETSANEWATMQANPELWDAFEQTVAAIQTNRYDRGDRRQTLHLITDIHEAIADNAGAAESELGATVVPVLRDYLQGNNYTGSLPTISVTVAATGPDMNLGGSFDEAAFATAFDEQLAIQTRNGMTTDLSEEAVLENVTIATLRSMGMTEMVDEAQAMFDQGNFDDRFTTDATSIDVSNTFGRIVTAWQQPDATIETGLRVGGVNLG